MHRAEQLGMKLVSCQVSDKKTSFTPHRDPLLLFYAELDITTHESGKHKLSMPSLLDFTDNFNVYGTGTDF
jgi:hypothetical protein